jgi:hypothetical protein
MLFLFRSVLCIGVVATVAAGGSGPGLQTAVSRAGLGLAKDVGQACIASRDCRRIGTTLVSAATQSASLLPEGPSPSGDTLQPSDLAPGWSSPAMRHRFGNAGPATSSRVAGARKAI